MKEELKTQKIRWNISQAMSCIFEKLSKSNCKTKKGYKQSLEKLMKLYNLNQTQTWILCMTCERFIESGTFSTLRDLADILDVPAMSIMKWKSEIDELVDCVFLEWIVINSEFMPVSSFCDSLYSNTSFIPHPKREIDEIEFLDYFANRYESRRNEDKDEYSLHRELYEYENLNKNLAMIKRVCKKIHHKNHRFILYDVANNVLRGGKSFLNSVIFDLYDGSKRYDIATEMMEETHELFQNGLLEFSTKGNLTDAVLTLSDKGKKLLLGEKAFLFEDTVNDKNLIHADKIYEKKLFYNKENKNEIDKLKTALQEENLQKIQKRLNEDGLPAGVSILFYGAPGTGKTETVMQIAKETGRDIVHVDISEIKSAWFGESEKQIKKIFSSYKNACEISRKKSERIPILLFNEADAIISKRKDSANGTCTQTENAIQNIILEELENLNGIFIATTNLASNMDSAFERRFLFKIKFDNPSTEVKTAIWMDKVSWMKTAEAQEFAKNYDFSGGQIDNIVRKITMNEIITGKHPKLSEIHDMCRREKN